LQRLSDYPRFIRRAPTPASASPSENLDPPNRLRDSTMLSVHSKPNDPNQTVDSQNLNQSERWGQNSAYATTHRVAFQLHSWLMDRISRCIAEWRCRLYTELTHPHIQCKDNRAIWHSACSTCGMKILQDALIAIAVALALAIVADGVMWTVSAAPMPLEDVIWMAP
jgi:hypothetical protein